MKSISETTTAEPRDDTDVGAASLQAAGKRLEALGAKYRKLLTAYHEVVAELSQLGANITCKAMKCGDVRSSDYELGLMAMEGLGPLSAVGRWHCVAYELLGGDQISGIKSYLNDDDDDIPFM